MKKSILATTPLIVGSADAVDDIVLEVEGYELMMEVSDVKDIAKKK